MRDCVCVCVCVTTTTKKKKVCTSTFFALSLSPPLSLTSSTDFFFFFSSLLCCIFFLFFSLNLSNPIKISSRMRSSMYLFVVFFVFVVPLSLFLFMQKKKKKSCRKGILKIVDIFLVLFCDCKKKCRIKYYNGRKNEKLKIKYYSLV